MHLSNRLVALCLTLIALGGPASATVLSGTSSATAISIGLTGALPISLPAIGVSSGSAAPAYNDMDTLLSQSVPGVLSTGVITTTAASDVDGLPGPRSASASAEINNLSLGLSLVLVPIVSVTAAEIFSSVSVSGEPLSGLGSASITGGSITIDSLAPIAIPINPAPNTVLVNTLGIQVILNEQIFSGSLGMTVNAIRISLVNALNLGINGDIILSQSQAALTSDSVIPEPSTGLLVGAGLALLATRGRRRN